MKGFKTISIKEPDYNSLKKLAIQKGCRGIPELLRRLIHESQSKSGNSVVDSPVTTPNPETNTQG